jgi:hypothetical protein
MLDFHDNEKADLQPEQISFMISAAFLTPQASLGLSEIPHL